PFRATQPRLHRRLRNGARTGARAQVPHLRDRPADDAADPQPDCGGGPGARSSYEAAVEARKLQEESLAAEQAKFEVGASTSFFVIQYESLLPQARSTEVAARSSYVKAKAALQRAMGTILDETHISVEAAIKGK